MSGQSKQHPGRSAEFLSRLHDGELDPGERAHFETHRAHCAECRRAAVEFEDALTLFRAARSRPPQADLAGRILRKIQTTSRSRAPFTARFRIDLGWAALLLTAIFALLITTPIVVRKQPEPAAPLPPAGDAPTTRTVVHSIPPASEPADPSLSKRESRTGVPPPSSPVGSVRAPVERPASAAAPPIAADRAKELADARADDVDRAERRAPAFAAEPGRAGGEEESVAAAAPRSPLHLSIEAIDGHGSPPPLLSNSRMAMPADYRGHEFILLVDSQGKVREVTPGPPGRDVRQKTARLAVPAPAALSELRFKPGNRPRRLLVRFE